MKKYLVIGNPIDHSLSPKLHNYWFKDENIDAIYEKKKINDDDIKNLILEIRTKKLHGINVTVPFKKKIIPYLDELSLDAKVSQSVNTIYLKNEKIVGHNTDIYGFENSIENCKFNLTDKKIFILGAGGVVSSLIVALKNKKVSKISVSNRTREKAEDLNFLFKDLNIVEWNNMTDFDMIINATSLGLNANDKINLDFTNVGKNKFFYDVIYNPSETNFLNIAKKLGHKTENGKMMFIFQASAAFETWHKKKPIINENVISILDT